MDTCKLRRKKGTTNIKDNGRLGPYHPLACHEKLLPRRLRKRCHVRAKLVYSLESQLSFQKAVEEIQNLSSETGHPHSHAAIPEDESGRRFGQRN